MKHDPKRYHAGAYNVTEIRDDYQRRISGARREAVALVVLYIAIIAVCLIDLWIVK